MAACGSQILIKAINAFEKRVWFFILLFDFKQVI
jgi:hypothetical protein